MIKILTSQTKNLEPSNQVTNKDKKIFKKEEYQAIYCAFLDTLKNLEKQTKQKLKEELLGKEKQKLHRDLESLNKQLKRLKNGNERKIFTSMSKNYEGIFNNINQEDIKLLSQENFCQLLLSVFEKIREEHLANEENLKNDEIKKAVAKCVADVRGTEAKDSFIKLAGWPLGVKVDPKNFLGSFKDSLLEKVPFFGKDKKEEDEPPLSDEEMVTTFLRQSLFPIILFSISALILNTGPIALAISGCLLLWTEVSTIKSLFSNNKKGTLYNPNSQDEKQRKEWDKEISDGISKILETLGEGAGKGEQPTEEQITQESEQSTMLEQVTLDQLAENIEKQPSKT